MVSQSVSQPITFIQSGLQLSKKQPHCILQFFTKQWVVLVKHSAHGLERVKTFGVSLLFLMGIVKFWIFKHLSVLSRPWSAYVQSDNRRPKSLRCTISWSLLRWQIDFSGVGARVFVPLPSPHHLAEAEVTVIWSRSTHPTTRKENLCVSCSVMVSSNGYAKVLRSHTT